MSMVRCLYFCPPQVGHWPHTLQGPPNTVPGALGWPRPLGIILVGRCLLTPLKKWWSLSVKNYDIPNMMGKVIKIHVPKPPTSIICLIILISDQTFTCQYSPPGRSASNDQAMSWQRCAAQCWVLPWRSVSLVYQNDISMDNCPSL